MTGRLWVASFFVVLALFFTGFASQEGYSFFEETPGELDSRAFIMADENGKRHTIADFKGKYVLVNLWAVWCPPCVYELPSLEKLQKKLGGDRFEVLAVSLDRDPPEKIKAFLKEHDAEGLAVWQDVTQMAQPYFNFKGVPTTILIDDRGAEVGRMNGFLDWGSPKAIELIESYISE